MTDNPEPTTSDTTGSQSTPPAGAPMTNYPRSGGGMVSQDDKTQAMLMWILAIFFHFVGPLIFLLISKDKPFVYRHSAMGLTLSIVTAILWCLGIPLAFIGIGFIVLPVAGILQLVGCIMGAVAANKGEEFDPPVIANIAKSMFKV